MAANPEHYGMTVQAMYVEIECGDHRFLRNGMQEGPCKCPICGRRFTLTWSANVEPKTERSADQLMAQDAWADNFGRS